MQISKNENRFYSVEILFSHDLHNFRLARKFIGNGLRRPFLHKSVPVNPQLNTNTMLKCH